MTSLAHGQAHAGSCTTSSCCLLQAPSPVTECLDLQLGMWTLSPNKVLQTSLDPLPKRASTL